MKKEELIHLHMLLTQVKKFFEEQSLDCDFPKYNELKISPFQVDRSKEEHKQAIFVLATEMASMATKINRNLMMRWRYRLRRLSPIVNK